MVRIALFSSQSFYSQVIKLATWSRWNHVAFVLESGEVLGALSQGVCITPIDYAGTRVEFFDVDCPNFNWDWLRAQLGKPYDWTAIAGLAMHRDWREDDSWFCSELLAAAFEHSDYPLLRADHLNRITPRDISMSLLIKRVTL